MAEEPMVEYIPQFRTTPFCIRIDGEEHFMSETEFKAFYAEMEEAAQAFEAEKIANREYLKVKYERARKRR